VKPSKHQSTGPQVSLPVEPGVVLLDIAFTDSDPKHGFLTGTRQTLLETKDGGKTWEPRFFESVEEEGINYRYNSISFSGDEGYIVGKPGAPDGLCCAALFSSMAHTGGNLSLRRAMFSSWAGTEVSEVVRWCWEAHSAGCTGWSRSQVPGGW
jgi:Photosynthesis system II assembly factor YCF48